MRLLGEEKKEGLKELFSSARCSFVFGGGGYFQGVKSVEEYTPERLVLSYKKGRVEITGKELRIGKYYEGDLALVGSIFSVCFKKIGEGESGV